MRTNVEILQRKYKIHFNRYRHSLLKARFFIQKYERLFNLTTFGDGEVYMKVTNLYPSATRVCIRIELIITVVHICGSALKRFDGEKAQKP